MLSTKDPRKPVRYRELTGSLLERRVKFQTQLAKFERDAKAGKLINLSDLIGNAESLHQR